MKGRGVRVRNTKPTLTKDIREPGLPISFIKRNGILSKTSDIYGSVLLGKGLTTTLLFRDRVDLTDNSNLQFEYDNHG